MAAKTFLILLTCLLLSLFLGCTSGGANPPTAENVLKIEGTGAYYVGHGASGKIDGKDYYFAILNAEGSEPGVSAAILVLDIDNPLKPVIVTTLTAPDNQRYLASLELYNKTLIVSASDYLWLVDVSNPGLPAELSVLSSVRAIRTVVSGNYVYANDSNSRIVAVDISDISRPVVAGELSMASATILAVSGSLLFATQGSVLNIIDISLPESPQVLGVFSHAYISNIVINGNMAYLGVYNDDGSGVLVLDFSDPAEPKEITTWEIPTETSPWFFTTDDGIYLGTSRSQPPSTTANFGLQPVIRKLDISSPDNPTGKSTLILPVDNQSTVQSRDIVGPYVYWFKGYYPEPPRIDIFKLE